jgi:pimeloyl-ACP methyl ester carboxylesterase
MFIDIRGSKQGMFIKGKDLDNPIILFLHGGIPVYFFHGLYDYTCSYEFAKKYFDNITAPIKGFYTFDQSAHTPLFEEPEKANRILINDVKNLRTDLADK